MSYSGAVTSQCDAKVKLRAIIRVQKLFRTKINNHLDPIESKQAIVELSKNVVKESLFKNRDISADNWVTNCNCVPISGDWEVVCETDDSGKELVSRMTNMENLLEEQRKELNKLKERERKRLLRCLIEVSRKQLWDSLFNQYFSLHPNEVAIRLQINVPCADVTYPHTWQHFITFARSQSNDISDAMAELLTGGKASRYGQLSSEVHNFEEDDIYEVVCEEGMSGYKELYHFVNW